MSKIIEISNKIANIIEQMKKYFNFLVIIDTFVLEMMKRTKEVIINTFVK